MAKTKSEKQFRFLMSKGSPLTAAEKQKLVSERRSGAVKVVKKKAVKKVIKRKPTKKRSGKKK